MLRLACLLLLQEISDFDWSGGGLKLLWLRWRSLGPDSPSSGANGPGDPFQLGHSVPRCSGFSPRDKDAENLNPFVLHPTIE
jgi:hypothetical protein